MFVTFIKKYLNPFSTSFSFILHLSVPSQISITNIPKHGNEMCSFLIWTFSKICTLVIFYAWYWESWSLYFMNPCCTGGGWRWICALLVTTKWQWLKKVQEALIFTTQWENHNMLFVCSLRAWTLDLVRLDFRSWRFSMMSFRMKYNISFENTQIMKH